MTQNQKTSDHLDFKKNSKLRAIAAKEMGLVFYDGIFSGEYSIIENPNSVQIYRVPTNSFNDCVLWTLENCKLLYSWYGGVFYFHKDEDTTEFIMRFL